MEGLPSSDKTDNISLSSGISSDHGLTKGGSRGAPQTALLSSKGRKVQMWIRVKADELMRSKGDESMSSFIISNSSQLSGFEH